MGRRMSGWMEMRWMLPKEERRWDQSSAGSLISSRRRPRGSSAANKPRYTQQRRQSPSPPPQGDPDVCLLARKWEKEISNHLSVWVCVSVPFAEIFLRHRTNASQKIPGYDLSPRCPGDGLGCDSYKDQLCNVMNSMKSSAFYTIKILMELHPWRDCRAVSKQANSLPQLCSQASQDMSANITFQHSAV